MNNSRFDDAEKTLVVVGDMMESFAESFYGDGFALIQDAPDKMIEKLSRKMKLPDMDGYMVYILYNALNDSSTKRDNQFTIAAKFWEILFTQAGAEVIIDSSLDL